ncbi:hypothetical protein S7711_05829 [Stachybotrys chartarum IBT 7711]|uniref:Mid2 domain-containing protein n=1 Tax=Stachybotrys chartarum (strain CBS 109288 / IBT 7711) TaxID=1280523 RepID=A0A084AM66_STACB|nr:hypothetical protein S7711_05829 [Stachybotrys chartarum IBT 7711]
MATFTGLAGTVLGPLTTSWVAPTFCTVHMLPCSTCSEGFRGQTCVIGTDGRASEQDHTGCWPPTTARAGTPEHPFVGWGFYSPGTECPTGYTAACTARYGRNPEWNIQFDLHESETALGCCPTGFECTNRNGNTCIQIAATQTDDIVVVQTGTCSGTDLTNIQLATFPDEITVIVTQTDDGDTATETRIARREITLLAPMIQINYQSSDMTPTETVRPSTGSSSTRDIPETTIPETNETGQREPGDSDTTATSGISGDTIGIIVGVTVGGLLALAGVAWLVWRRRGRRRASKPPAHEHHASPIDAYESKYRQDTSTWIPPAEMAGHHDPVELPGSLRVNGG